MLEEQSNLLDAYSNLYRSYSEEIENHDTRASCHFENFILAIFSGEAVLVKVLEETVETCAMDGHVG